MIVAPAGRALAASARRSGFRPLVLDLFDDLDTRAFAVANVSIDAMEHGFEAEDLIDPLLCLAQGRDPAGIVYGGGFEDRPQLIAELARHFRLYGNTAETVERVKDPQWLATLCRELAIPHPEIRFARPRDPEHWLIKKSGGGGGLHIALASSRTAEPGEYYQRRVSGQPISAMLLCAARSKLQILGLSEQWATASSGKPFRFAGAARPANIAPELAGQIAAAAEAIAARAGLVGLNSVDFLADNDGFHLLEINPRPGATLDIYSDCDGKIFVAHIDACEGRLPTAPLIFPRAAAASIVYTPIDLTPMPPLVWPEWCHDRQKPGTDLRKGDPVCTVSAEAESIAAARALLDERLAVFLKILTESASKEAAA
ncbi:MAG: ATP-grasp domain-containing protein [Beijerinckiaceae bacterium]|nr:MAG: ATP-grasp domain-containing protein [Beijerinckiaceae bacterium]